MLATESYRALNRQLHEERPDYGALGVKWAAQVQDIARAVDAKTILDYGCGKGSLGRALSHLLVMNYDPAMPGLDATPDPADLVVCTDVLEHIEPDCLNAVLDDLKRCALKAIFMTVATRPAKKFLPDGRNAHLIQEPLRWWLPKIVERWDLRMLNAIADEFALFALREGNNAHETDHA